MAETESDDVPLLARKCPICEVPLTLNYRDVHNQCGPILEEQCECPTGHYLYEYAYGHTEEWFGEERKSVKLPVHATNMEHAAYRETRNRMAETWREIWLQTVRPVSEQTSLRGATVMIDIPEFFEEHVAEYLKEDCIKPERRLHRRADINAFLLLDKLAPEDPMNRDMVSNAYHNMIYIQVSPDDIAETATEEDLLDLIRCGVIYDEDSGSFQMHV